MLDVTQNFKEEAERFNKVVIWGLRKKFHTHRYVFKGFYRAFKKMGIKVVWVEDEKESQKIIEKNDFIIAAEVNGRMVKQKFKLDDYDLPVRDDVYYCLHNYNTIFTDLLDKDRLINAQVYENLAEETGCEKWGEAVFFNKEKRILHQPWGTSLLPNEFKKPVFNKHKTVFWIGSVWNDKTNCGNLNEIDELKKVLGKNNINFKALRFVPDFLNVALIRHSRLAPAIGGRMQVEKNYLPCRMFKNISYGQLGFSNIKKFDDVYQGATVKGETIEELVENVLSLNEKEYKELIGKQQEITKNYTYLNYFLNLFKTFK